MFMLSKETYLDKMRGCWLGKAIGGTLGAPFEPTRGAFDVEYYTTDLKNGMLPNDDLDLQLVRLNAAERFGASVSAELLAEYWMLNSIYEFCTHQNMNRFSCYTHMKQSMLSNWLSGPMPYNIH